MMIEETTVNGSIQPNQVNEAKREPEFSPYLQSTLPEDEAARIQWGSDGGQNCD